MEVYLDLRSLRKASDKFRSTPGCNDEFRQSLQEVTLTVAFKKLDSLFWLESQELISRVQLPLHLSLSLSLSFCHMTRFFRLWIRRQSSRAEKTASSPLELNLFTLD